MVNHLTRRRGCEVQHARRASASPQATPLQSRDTASLSAGRGILLAFPL